MRICCFYGSFKGVIHNVRQYAKIRLEVFHKVYFNSKIQIIILIYLLPIMVLIFFQHTHGKFNLNLLNLHALFNVRAICVLNIFRALENQFEF